MDKVITKITGSREIPKTIISRLKALGFTVEIIVESNLEGRQPTFVGETYILSDINRNFGKNQLRDLLVGYQRIALMYRDGFSMVFARDKEKLHVFFNEVYVEVSFFTFMQAIKTSRYRPARMTVATWIRNQNSVPITQNEFSEMVNWKW